MTRNSSHASVSREEVLQWRIIHLSLCLLRLQLHDLPQNFSERYVPQYDTLLGSQTVYETVYFAARLRLPEANDAKLRKNVDQLLVDLDLAHVKDVPIGDALIKGISGGQKKRVSTAIELVTRPSIIFLDEPTSGLDSFASLQLITMLKKIAKEQKAIICATIHQPSSELFAQFDRVMCMRFGEVLFHGMNGLRAEALRQQWGKTDPRTIILINDWLAKIAKKPIPEGFNTCDWLLYQAQAQSDDAIREDIELTARLLRGQQCSRNVCMDAFFTSKMNKVGELEV